jgi:hypothetical protein
LHPVPQLRKWLEDFAEELKRRTETVARDVQQLVEQTSVVELNLLNTLNSLQVLSATQFIENVSRGKMLKNLLLVFLWICCIALSMDVLVAGFAFALL